MITGLWKSWGSLVSFHTDSWEETSSSGVSRANLPWWDVDRLLSPQVLFNEQQSQYVKLDVVTSGQRPQKLQCMEGYGTTPSAGPHPFHFLKPCQVSGLLRLDRGTELQAITGSSFRLHTVGNPSASPHIFSIFKVNWSSGSFFTQTHLRTTKITCFRTDGIFYFFCTRLNSHKQSWASHRATASSWRR